MSSLFHCWQNTCLFLKARNNPNHKCPQWMGLVSWLVVFNVPSTARSFRDGTPIDS